MIAVDLFAGPGGWDVAAHWLGVDPLGIEWDDAACRVREAAGLRTLQADVAALDPLDFPCDLLIASPPCTAFSMAGKGAGRDAMDELLAGVSAMDDFGLCAHGVEDFGGETDRPPIPYLNIEDPTAPLVLELLRWALALQPDTVCCEQVPPVLPLWEAMATVLRRRGYHTWTGIISSERYGVPQTRRRAILIASKLHRVGEPVGTHQRYVAPRNRDDEGGGLFDLPDPERIVAKGDEHLKPWVSMADALGWGMTARPYLAIASSRTTGGPDKEKVGGSGARDTIYAEQEAGRWTVPTVQYRRGGERLEEEWTADRPSDTVTSRTDRWQVTGLDRRQTSGEGEVVPVVPLDRPAPTMTAAGLAGGRDVWVGERPATTIAGDPRVQPPGHKINGDDEAAGREYDGRAGENAVRVTVEQAARLQGFPDNYPWGAAGSRSKAFQCIGNAVPPPMAQAVLREAIGGSDHE